MKVYFEKYLLIILHISTFQIGESNDKPYEPARVCQETAICQGGERGEAKEEFIKSCLLCCISQLYKLPSCPVAISRFTRTSSPRMRKCCCQPTHEVPTSSHPCLVEIHFFVTNQKRKDQEKRKWCSLVIWYEEMLRFWMKIFPTCCSLPLFLSFPCLGC